MAYLIENFSDLPNEKREAIIFAYLDERNLEIADKGSQLKLVKQCQGLTRENEDLRRERAMQKEDDQHKRSLDTLCTISTVLALCSHGSDERNKALMIINIELDKLLPKTTISMPKVDCNNER